MSVMTTLRPEDRDQAVFTAHRKTYHWFSRPVDGLTTTWPLVPTSGSESGPAGATTVSGAVSTTVLPAGVVAPAPRGVTIVGGSAMGTGTARSTSGSSLRLEEHTSALQ